MERFHSTLAASTLVIVGYLSTVHSLHHIFTTAEMWVIDSNTNIIKERILVSMN
jgi:hypothetical protein